MRLRVLGAAIILSVIGVTSAAAAPGVLVLFSEERALLSVQEFETSLLATLGLPEVDVEYSAEFLDLPRFSGPDVNAVWREFLTRKYAGHDVRVIVVVGVPAMEVLLELQADIFPGVPVVVCSVLRRSLAERTLPENYTVVPLAYDFAGTVELARQLQPDATEVVVPVGSSDLDQFYASIVRSELAAASRSLPVRYLERLSIEAISAEVSALTPSSIGLLIPFYRDGAGRVRPPIESRRRITAASGTAQYTPSSTSMGTGVVGGRMTTFRQMGEEAGAMVRRALAGDRLPAVAPSAAPTVVVDWRALQRWGLDESRLPVGTEIRFKPRTLWEERKGLIITVSSLLLLQAVSLVALLVQRRRRDAAEVQAHAHRNDLAHLSRVALLGELSTSFAHELNQPLTAILSYAQAGQRFLAMPDPNLDHIRVILGDIASNDRRAAEVIRRLRELMKKGEPRLQAVQCQEIVESVLRLAAQDLVSRKVSVTTDLPAALQAKADRVQLQQVLLNLVMNAADAVRTVATPQRRIVIRAARRTDDTVEVIVSDRGGGIPEDQLQKVFEPFFTTKAEGLGMGLSISRTLVESHGGRMWASNNAEGGASLHLILPAA